MIKPNRIAGVCICVCFSLLLLPLLRCFGGTAAKSTPDNFDVKADKMVTALLQGDLKNFIPLVSSEWGLRVVRRRMDRESMAKKAHPLKEPQMPEMIHGNGAELCLGGQNAVIREEVEINYEKSELAKKEFVRVFKQFQYFAKESRHDYHGPVKSPNVWAEGDMDGIWPGVAGKMYSNCVWRGYFRKEKNEWRLWKLEVETTH